MNYFIEDERKEFNCATGALQLGTAYLCKMALTPMGKPLANISKQKQHGSNKYVEIVYHMQLTVKHVPFVM